MNKRIDIKDIRRRELINATRLVVAREGFETTTVAKIAAEAGFSIGFMHHHFRNKDALLAETMRVVYGDMAKLISARLCKTTNAEQRLRIILEGNFDPEIYTKANALIWVSFVPRVAFNAEFTRLQTVIERRTYSNIASAIRPIAPDANIAPKVVEVETLINGYWLRLGLHPDRKDNLRQEALEQIARYSAALTQP
ncbi:transcriptional regulator BetI [Yoonia sp.]|uniref:transcriptional regulator BetI n=1 Tax=Yoonia sp. TaxID=2212373 RepID=UPI003974A20D